MTRIFILLLIVGVVYLVWIWGYVSGHRTGFRLGKILGRHNELNEFRGLYDEGVLKGYEQAMAELEGDDEDEEE